jgi:predicted Zn-dependent protease
MIFLFTALFLFFTPLGLEAKEPFESPVFQAMESELKRSMKHLKFEDFKAPYFIAYDLIDALDTSFSLRHGGLVQDKNEHQRNIYVELRYGDYEMDNTHQNYQGVSDLAPFDADPEALRHRFWLITDQAYKQAVSHYLNKKGKRLVEIEKEKVGDFWQEKQHQKIIPGPPPPKNLEAYKNILKKVSQQFLKQKIVLDSNVSLTVHSRTRFYVNSEGTRVFRPESGNPFFVYIWVRSQSEDGMSLDLDRTFSVRSEEQLPSEETLEKTIQEMVALLEKLRHSKIADPTIAPAILDSQSTGVLFHEALGHRLEGERQQDTEEGQTFKGQLGKIILPEFLMVEDNPSLTQWNGVALNGYYEVDDEGVPAQNAELIRNGVLWDYLLSRRPIKGFKRSNGHGRAQFGRDPIGRMSNLVIQSTKEVSDKVLKEMLLEECKKQNKPYGLLIRKTQSGDTFTGRGQYQAFRATPEEVYLVDANTGEEVLVRGVEVVGTPLLTINKILATNNRYEVNNAFCGAESGTVPVSTVAPSCLVQEIELQRLLEDKQRPPILEPPFFD